LTRNHDFQVRDSVYVSYGFGWDGYGLITDIQGNSIQVLLNTGKHAGHAGFFFPAHLEHKLSLRFRFSFHQIKEPAIIPAVR
jgi:hypothetical protein